MELIKSTLTHWGRGGKKIITFKFQGNPSISLKVIYFFNMHLMDISWPQGMPNHFTKNQACFKLHSLF